MPSREYYDSNSPQLTAYYKLMVDVAILLGAKKELALIEMNETLSFERQLALITIPSEQRRNYTAIYRKVMLDELSNELSDIDWIKYLDILMSPAKVNATEEPVIVYATSYFVNLTTLLRTTPKKTVANYIFWRFVYNRIGNLDKRFLEVQQTYFKSLYGTQQRADRWKTCVVYVNKNMGMAVGALFVRKHFNEQSKERVSITSRLG